MYNLFSRPQVPSPAPTTVQSIAVKVFLNNNETRRTKLSVTTFTELEEVLRTNYVSTESQDHHLVLKYRDERNDWITFDTEEEFQDALELLRFEQSRNPTSALCVSITVGEKKPTPVIVVPIVEEEIITEELEQLPVSYWCLSDSDVSEDEEVQPSSDAQIILPAVDSVGEALPQQDSFVMVVPASVDLDSEYFDTQTDSATSSIDSIEEARKSVVDLRQSIGSFINLAPVRALPVSNYDEESSQDDYSEVEQVTSVKPVVPIVEEPVEAVAESVVPTVEEPVVEAVAEPVAPAVVVPSAFERQVAFLKEMGIEITQENVDRLAKHKGDLAAMVNSMFLN